MGFPCVTKVGHRVVVGTLVAISALIAGCTSTTQGKHEFAIYSKGVRQSYDWSATKNDSESSALKSLVTPSRQLTSAEELFNFALEHHPDLLAAHAEWGSALRSIDASRRQPDAMLSWSESILPVETRLGSIDRRFMLEQRFFNPWKLDARENQAAVIAMRRRIAFMEVADRIKRDISLGFADIRALDARVHVLNELKAILEAVEELIEANIITSQATQAQLLRAQVEREELESQIEQETLRRRSLVARLAEACGASAEITIPESTLEADLPDLSEQRVKLNAGLVKHPLIALQNSLVLLQDKMLEEAEAESLPDFSAALEYSMIGDRPGDVEDEALDAIALRVGITIPWHSGVYEAKEDSIRLQRLAEQRKADSLLLKLLRRLEDQLFAHGDARREFLLYGSSILPKAKQTLELVQNDFAVNRATLADVLDAERAVLGSELALIRSRQSALKSQAELHYLTGIDITKISEGE